MGKKCVFPFRFDPDGYHSERGVLENYCIKSNHNKLWCATQVDKDGNYLDDQWGECSDDCGTETCTSARARDECKSKPYIKVPWACYSLGKGLMDGSSGKSYTCIIEDLFGK